MTYSGDPTTSQLDAVRFWLQDTGSPGLLNDDELRYFIEFAADYTDSEILLAAELCAVVQAKYAGVAEITGDGITYSQSQLQDKYGQLATTLRQTYERISGSLALPFAGGIERCAVEYFDRRPPVFAVGMHDNPNGESQLDGSSLGYPYGEPYRDTVYDDLYYG